jgi:hypothetical protein
MPRNISCQLQPPQRPTHLPCATPSTDEISDLTVGGKSAIGDLLHNGPNALIKGWLNQGLITFRHWQFLSSNCGPIRLVHGQEILGEKAQNQSASNF